MVYATGRKNPNYLTEYRALLKEAHIYNLRQRGVPCACVACGATIEGTALGFLTAEAEPVPLKELLRRADFKALLDACLRTPLACARCRYDWRAGVRARFPDDLRAPLYGNRCEDGW